MTQSRDALFLETAVDAASKAGEITLKYFRKSIEIDRKPDQSPVTIADRETEQFLRERLIGAFPDHGFLGEEFGEVNPGSEYRWIVDPIDGTKSYIHGVPLFGVMVALEHKGEALLGVIHHPALEETVCALAGGGCYYNGVHTKVCDGDPPLLCMSSASTMYEIAPRVTENILKAFPLQRTWGDCYGYTLIATGRAQVMVDPIMNLWDLAALKPIIEEAGGVFSDWSGKSSIHISDSIAGTPPWHEKALAITREHRL